MLAMFSTTPSSSSSGLRLSRASWKTSIACSTPCSEKYLGSVESTAWVAATSALTVSNPSVGGAVDQHDVVVALDVAQRVTQRHLAADLSGEHELGLGEAEVRGDHL